MVKLLSTKRLQINKANTMMVAVLAVASFVTVFSMIASKALLSQRAYQAKVIAQKRETLNTLKANNQAVTTLVTSYQAFVQTSENVIGGSPDGKGDKDGDNAKIILDALPSKYDFPALVTSLQKVLSGSGLGNINITGTDDEVNQSSQTDSGTPQPVVMPFTASVTGNYKSLQNLLTVLERSIRPIQIQAIKLSGSDNDLVMEITAQTYYQPGKALTLGSKEIE